MAEVNRRELLAWMLIGAAAGSTPAAAHDAPCASAGKPAPQWARGIEGQCKADLGDGTFLNPIVPGDHPDPSILRDGTTTT